MRLSVWPKGLVVYKITHRSSGRAYVGMSCDLRKRVAGHISKANRGFNSPLSEAIRSFGRDAFSVEVIGQYKTRREAADSEIALIEWLGSQENGYNVTGGGDGVRSLRPESRAKQRAALSRALRGKPHSAAHNQAVSEALSGLPKSEAHREALRRSATGRKASAEARARMSAARSGKPLSADHVQAIARANRGKRRDPETRERVRKAAVESRGRKVVREDGLVFEALTQAAESLDRTPKACPSAIRRACTGKVSRAYGYKWRFLEEENA